LKKQFKRLIASSEHTPDEHTYQIPFINECSPKYQTRDIFHCPGGCLQVLYCSKKCSFKAWDQYHEILCNGNNSESSLGTLLQTPFLLGQLDHADHFFLATRLIAMIIQTSKQIGMEEAVKTLESFFHEPWTTIPFGRESLSAETYCTQKENMLKIFEQILKGLFLSQAHELDLFLSFVNLANLLGKISLNCQERTPFPPVVLYLDNLKDLASSMTQEILEISKANDLRQKALHQAKGQALFKLHSGLNHSCAPNALVVTPKEGNQHL